MKRSSQWVINEDVKSSFKGPSGPVMAWARDIKTGEPVYIMELDESRAKSHCGCECPSCNLALIAVNAAKKEYGRRPHFRHPVGAPKAECMYLSARLAALQLLRDQGFIQLPRRQHSGFVIGLSGTQHEAWVEHPPEKVRIRDFNFHDKAAAILTLEDGRQLKFQLLGTGATAISDGSLVATILLDLKDAAVAGMNLEELRSRITLVPDAICWLKHWQDEELKSQVNSEARKLADNFMDLADSHEVDLCDVDKQFRRETLLHLEVKKILAESLEIKIPELSAFAKGITENGEVIERHWSRPSETIALLDVQLEKQFGSLIPDVMAVTPSPHGGMLIIEITVTNHINDERLLKIKNKNIPTLEIDLSLSGGLISRNELKELVIQGLELKRWLHHPAFEFQTQIIENEVEAKVFEIDELEHQKQEYRKAVLATPLKEIVRDFLEAVIYSLHDKRTVNSDQFTQESIEQAKKYVNIEAEKLSIHGYPEACEKNLTANRKGIIPRILSIKLGKGVGYQLETTLDVMNAIRQSSLLNRSNHTLYLIAEKVYRPEQAPAQPQWFIEWVNEVKESIRKNEEVYIRDGRYDRLLTLLFPEMTSSLSNGYGSARGLRRKPKVSITQSPTNLNAVKQICDFYSDGAFRHFAPKINFDDVLWEADALKKGESYMKWFQIWSDRYQLNYDLHPIVQFLSAAGFYDAKEQLIALNAKLQKMKLDREYRSEPAELQPSKLQPRKPVVVSPINLYALAKGREQPKG